MGNCVFCIVSICSEKKGSLVQNLKEENMINILKKLIPKKEGKQEVVEMSGEEVMFLPQTSDYLDIAKQYNQIMFFYRAGIHQITAKLQILNEEFQNCYDRNPIETIKSRVKSQESILYKMEKRRLPLTYSSMVNNIYDIAGVRVICPFISDVYQVAKMLLSQTDVELIEIKDYIKNPKENGYRSLHLIVAVNVFFSDQKRKVPVEVQLRTIAMNFWASLEHQLRYKKDREFTQEMQEELLECAGLMADADSRMQKLADSLNE